MSVVRTFLVGLFLVLVVAGCANVEQPGAALHFDGSIAYKEFEGGFWAVDADDGRKFFPLNLPETFRQDGLKVRVEANEKSDVMDVHMYGTVIEIVTIDKRQ